MHHVVLERWSRGQSLVHSRDPRAKIAALLAFLVVLATSPLRPASGPALYGLFLTGAVLLSRLPLTSICLRAGMVLPFSLAFAVTSVAAGEPGRAWALVAKSYLSALAVLVVAGTTPFPDLLQGLERMGTPRFLVMVVQFLYRYLFVVSEQAQHMRLAAASRGGHRSGWTRRLRAAAGAIAVLFARSYARAEGIHQAMLARGYHGRLPTLATHRFGWEDAVFLLLATLIPLGLRAAAGQWK